ncbi:MAG: hypothetical protein RLZZ519_1069 [Bacteroidota bacterium]|jgi:hypothetical protein
MEECQGPDETGMMDNIGRGKGVRFLSIWLLGLLFATSNAFSQTQPASSDGNEEVYRATSASAHEGYIMVDFYTVTLTLPEIPKSAISLPKVWNDAAYQSVYSQFDSSAYHPFLKKLGDYRRGMSIGDWHFFLILAEYSEFAFKTQGPDFPILFQWFILRKSGIDARLMQVAGNLFLNVRSQDIEFGFYILEQEGYKFANLTARRDGLKLDKLPATLSAPMPDGADMPFTMRMSQMPRLLVTDTVERLIEFKHKDQTHKVRVKLNKNWLQVMDDYPYYNPKSYFEIGMSREAENSLLPALRKLIEYKSNVEKVEFLLSFTRTAFFYKDDAGRYGKEKPMAPEQTLYHSYSDCEDRSALFFYLCRKLIGLPEIVLDFETHVGCAVVLDGVTGDYYKYKGRKFVYCEPTGPQDLLKPGEMWEKVKAQKASILFEYIPE